MYDKFKEKVDVEFKGLTIQELFSLITALQFAKEHFVDTTYFDRYDELQFVFMQALKGIMNRVYHIDSEV